MVKLPQGCTYLLVDLDVLGHGSLLAGTLELLPRVVLVLGGEVEGAWCECSGAGGRYGSVIDNVPGAGPVQSPSVACL